MKITIKSKPVQYIGIPRRGEIVKCITKSEESKTMYGHGYEYGRVLKINKIDTYSDYWVIWEDEKTTGGIKVFRNQTNLHLIYISE